MPYNPEEKESIYFCRACCSGLGGLVIGVLIMMLFSAFWLFGIALGLIVFIIGGIGSAQLYAVHVKKMNERDELTKILLPLKLPKHNIHPPEIA